MMGRKLEGIKKTVSQSWVFVGSIKRKLIFSFSIVIFVLFIVSTLPLYLFKQPIEQYDSILQTVVDLNDIVKTTDEIMSETIVFTRSQSNELKKKHIEEVENLNEIIKKIKNNKNIRTDVKSLDETIQNVKVFIQLTDDILSGYSGDMFADLEKAKIKNEQIARDIKNKMLLEIQKNETFRKSANAFIEAVTVGSLIADVIVAIICLFVSYTISKNIADPVSRISEAADKIAQGDITVSIPKINTNDEIKILSLSFEKMIANLKEMLSNLKDTSYIVKEYSSLLSRGTQETAAISEEISSGIQSVADSSKRLTEIIEGINDDISNVFSILGPIAEQSSTASSSSREATIIADEGIESIRKVISQMENINITIHDSVKVSDVLNEKSSSISETVDLISSVADQTNLLALNAAIEAARAGEHGKGFGVVAEEIRKLADNTSKATRHIDSTIKEVLNLTGKLSIGMGRGTSEITTGVGIVKDTENVIERLQASNDILNTYVSNNNTSINGVFGVTENIKKSSSNIVNISKSFSENSEEVASASEELSAHMQESLIMANKLNDVAEKLDTLIKKFSIG